MRAQRHVLDQRQSYIWHLCCRANGFVGTPHALVQERTWLASALSSVVLPEPEGPMRASSLW